MRSGLEHELGEVTQSGQEVANREAIGFWEKAIGEIIFRLNEEVKKLPDVGTISGVIVEIENEIINLKPIFGEVEMLRDKVASLLSTINLILYKFNGASNVVTDEIKKLNDDFGKLINKFLVFLDIDVISPNTGKIKLLRSSSFREILQRYAQTNEVNYGINPPFYIRGDLEHFNILFNEILKGGGYTINLELTEGGIKLTMSGEVESLSYLTNLEATEDFLQIMSYYIVRRILANYSASFSELSNGEFSISFPYFGLKN